MSRAYGDDDSDEDKVVYLDYDNRSEPSKETTSSLERTSAPKFKPLFQHRRYQGDVSWLFVVGD